MNLPRNDISKILSFEQLLEQPELGLKLARTICEKYHLPAECTRLTDGSRPVFSAAERYIIKIFSPEDVDFFRTESLFLSRLYRQLPLQTPELVAADYWGNCPYLIMEQLQGRPLSRLWSGLSEAEQAYLVSQLGHAIRALHSLPVESFTAAPFQWQPLIEAQQSSLLDHHRGYGLEPAWLAQLPDYLDSCGLKLHEPARLGPLHTELMPEHLFVKQVGARWRLSGLIDFEPAMVGQVAYEFCAVGLFLTQGNKALFRLFLSSYGYNEAELTPGLSRKIMGLMLLHRYSNLKRFFSLLPAHQPFTGLGQLEQYWYGLD